MNANTISCYLGTSDILYNFNLNYIIVFPYRDEKLISISVRFNPTEAYHLKGRYSLKKKFTLSLFSRIIRFAMTNYKICSASDAVKRDIYRLYEVAKSKFEIRHSIIPSTIIIPSNYKLVYRRGINHVSTREKKIISRFTLDVLDLFSQFSSTYVQDIEEVISYFLEK